MKIIGYLIFACNLISSIILCLVLRLVKRMVDKVKFGREYLENEIKLNFTVTLAHICLILGYTTVSVIYFILPTKTSGRNMIAKFREETSWVFFGGVSDLFLTCMLWFTLDEKAGHNILVIG